MCVCARYMHRCACVRILVTGRVDARIWPVCQCERRQLTRSCRPLDGAQLGGGLLTSHPAPRPVREPRSHLDHGERRYADSCVRTAQSPLGFKKLGRGSWNSEIITPRRRDDDTSGSFR